MKIYTRMGDGGETSLPGGRRVSKTEAIFETLGNLDETNAAIGVAISFLRATKFPIHQLHDIQSNLLAIGACLASDNPREAKILKELDKLTDRFEAQIDQWDKQLPPLKNFILPEGTSGAASLHLCRTLVRRTERSYYLMAVDLVSVARYLNRLSDYFFQAARYVNYLERHREQIWKL